MSPAHQLSSTQTQSLGNSGESAKSNHPSTFSREILRLWAAFFSPRKVCSKACVADNNKLKWAFDEAETFTLSIRHGRRGRCWCLPGCKVNVRVNYSAVNRVGSSRRRWERAEAVSQDGFLPVEVITLKYPECLSYHAGRPNVKQSAINSSARLGMSPLILDVL